MDIKSLMIGDWVIFHDSGYASDGTTWEENRVCQIDNIDEDVRVKWYDESGCKEYEPHVSTVFLSPIPLTAEILEKNGHKIIGYAVWDLDCGAEVQWVPETLDTINPHMQYRLAPRQKNFGVQDTLICHIKYVHQLQHALRLCEIDKTIEL